MSVALRIWAPMLALRGADGAPAMGADLLPPEQRKALELRLAADFAAGVRGALALAALVDPGAAALLSMRLSVQVVDEDALMREGNGRGENIYERYEPPAPTAADLAVPLPDARQATCFYCRAPATTYEIRANCDDCARTVAAARQGGGARA